MLVRHADPAQNRYRTRWYIGDVSKQGAQIDVGDGGDACLREDPGGRRVGITVGNQVRWSPDSKQIAYTAFRNIFPEEYHVKWQPAHRLAIYNRNLDWFRFWLQDVEDPDPAKSEQYQRWRELRKLQCQNPRSVRDNCAVEITKRSPAK